MKKGKRWFALCVLAVLMLAMSSYIWAVQLPEDVRYFYQLVPVGTDEKVNEFRLYVERTDASGKPLHAGSIALRAPSPLTFEPADGWTTTPHAQEGTASFEARALEDTPYHYISFFWYWEGTETSKELPAASEGYTNRQLIGTVKAEYVLSLDLIELLPWPETAAGAERLGKLNSEPDREAQLGIVESVWRMPDIATPLEGYYQGYYAEERADAPTEGQQYAVDLTAGWQGFTIGAYAPTKPATLLFYRHSDDGADPALYAVAKAEFDYSGVGYFKGRIDFSTLAPKDPETEESVSLIDGVYDIVILKPSHVQCTIKGVEFDEANLIFPELQGLHVEIPCGDLVTAENAEQLNLRRGDGYITLRDRSVLQACLNGGVDTESAEYIYADLNGDRVVSLADLDILMSAENYNKVSIIIEGKGAGT